MSHPVLAAVVAIPALIFGVFVAYQMGDYLDPAESPHHAYAYTGETRAEAVLKRKLGTALKQGAIGTGAAVVIPIAGVIGLALYLMSNNKRGGGGGNYDD